MKNSLFILLCLGLAACSRTEVKPEEKETIYDQPVFNALSKEIKNYGPKLMIKGCKEKPNSKLPVAEEMAKELVGLGYYGTQPEMYSHALGQIAFLYEGGDVDESALQDKAKYLMQKRIIEMYMIKQDMMKVIATNDCVNKEMGELLYDLGSLYGIMFLEVPKFNEGFMSACDYIYGAPQCKQLIKENGVYLLEEDNQKENMPRFLEVKKERLKEVP